MLSAVVYILYISSLLSTLTLWVGPVKVFILGTGEMAQPQFTCCSFRNCYSILLRVHIGWLITFSFCHFIEDFHPLWIPKVSSTHLVYIHTFRYSYKKNKNKCLKKAVCTKRLRVWPSWNGVGIRVNSNPRAYPCCQCHYFNTFWILVNPSITYRLSHVLSYLFNDWWC